MATAKKTLVQKLHVIWQEMPDYVKKDGKNTHFHYTYLSERKIKETIAPLFKKAGIMFRINVTDATVTPVGSMQLTTAKMEYVFVDVATGEEIKGTFIGQGTDSGDKGIYKAVTGAIKYIMMSMFLIPSGDDPEKDENSTKPSKKSSVSDLPPAVQNALAVSKTLYVKLKEKDPQAASGIYKQFKGKLTTVEAVKQFNDAMRKAIAEEEAAQTETEEATTN